MNQAAPEKRRRGGREARRALSATPEPWAQRPVRGGLEGGRYKSLSEGDLARIHGAVLDLLEQVGLGDPIPSCVELLTAGGEAAWRRRPFVSMSTCFMVPPLTFAEEACRCFELGVAEGMPILLVAAAQAGATAPAALAGAVAQSVAEVVAGLNYVNAVRPGARAIFAPWPFVSDLRTDAMSGAAARRRWRCRPAPSWPITTTRPARCARA